MKRYAYPVIFEKEDKRFVVNRIGVNYFNESPNEFAIELKEEDCEIVVEGFTRLKAIYIPNENHLL